MNVFQVLHSMVSPQAVKDHLVLRNGQIVNATLVDMFANGDAKVSIQGHMVRAKLETPMAKGEHTFMQVQSFHNGVVVMKLLATNEAAASSVPSSNINQLLKNTDLPQNTAWREAIQQMMQRNIPLLPDILQNGVAVLGKTPAADHIQTWLSMLERNIPVSANSFQAVHQLLHGLSVSTLVNELKGVVQQLLSQGSTQGSTQLQSAISKEQHSPATGSSTILTAGANQETSIQLSTNKSGELPSTQMMGNRVSTPVTGEQGPVRGDKADGADIGKIFSQGLTSGRLNADAIGQLVKLNQLLDDIVQTSKQVIPQGTGDSFVSPGSAGANESPIAQLMKLFGYQHERQSVTALQASNLVNDKSPEVSGSSGANDNKAGIPADNAKQLLIQLSANSQIPQAVREIAQQLLHNVTGQQLMSLPQEQQTMNQSIMVQIPVHWGDNQQDTLTMQVQGRKDKKTLDPANCSIYLNLHPPNLGDLGVFVHIVSKVVSIKLFSDNQSIKQIADNTSGVLKQGLSEQGYLLSFIKVEAQQQEKTHHAIAAYGKTSAKGIDIRI